jgi:hypothetical protein
MGIQNSLSCSLKFNIGQIITVRKFKIQIYTIYIIYLKVCDDAIKVFLDIVQRTGHVNQAEHRPSERVKTHIKFMKITPHTRPSTNIHALLRGIRNGREGNVGKFPPNDTASHPRREWLSLSRP